MARSLLTLLLLLNYLLVVGVGLLVSKPAAPRYTAAHPYVHSAECQRHNYLRLDCFEHCNGDQHEARQVPVKSGQHLLAQLKGLDEHYPAGRALVLPTVAPTYGRPAAPRPAPGGSVLPVGYGGRDYPPPQCG